MTDARRWLDSRTPPPPGELRAAVEAALEQERGESTRAGPDPDVNAALVASLTSAAGARLASALGRPGRARESAYDLLAADALATYAAEAALETEEPGAALVRLARRLLDAGEAP